MTTIPHPLFIESDDIIKNLRKMGNRTVMFKEHTPEFHEACRIRISGYLCGLVDAGSIPEDKKKEIFGKVWLWFEWNGHTIRNP